MTKDEKAAFYRAAERIEQGEGYGSCLVLDAELHAPGHAIPNIDPWHPLIEHYVNLFIEGEFEFMRLHSLVKEAIAEGCDKTHLRVLMLCFAAEVL